MKTSNRRLWWVAGIIGLALTLWFLSPTWVRCFRRISGRPAGAAHPERDVDQLRPHRMVLASGKGRSGRDVDLRVNQLPE
ncbi:MAG: hypothetical protein QGH70_10810 [Nitrospinota bacterium]|jgi:hypothetical protein|nr:hypothetical protein [Nitrospinota bacterium]MDP6484320.1 hypothetical protein [Nitrospinota bacterium]MDP7385406.1 hypothetical protein [Nitrospinota bacterium]